MYVSYLYTATSGLLWRYFRQLRTSSHENNRNLTIKNNTIIILSSEEDENEKHRRNCECSADSIHKSCDIFIFILFRRENYYSSPRQPPVSPQDAVACLCPADTGRHEQTQADTSRHEQTRADTSRHKQTQADTSRHRASTSFFLVLSKIQKMPVPQQYTWLSYCDTDLINLYSPFHIKHIDPLSRISLSQILKKVEHIFIVSIRLNKPGW